VQQALDLISHPHHVVRFADERGFAVDGILVRAAVGSSDQGGSAGHRLHGREPEALVPACAQEDPAAVVDVVHDELLRRIDHHLDPRIDVVRRANRRKDDCLDLRDTLLDLREHRQGLRRPAMAVASVCRGHQEWAVVDRRHDAILLVIEPVGDVDELDGGNALLLPDFDQPPRDTDLRAGGVEHGFLGSGDEGPITLHEDELQSVTRRNSVVERGHEFGLGQDRGQLGEPGAVDAQPLLIQCGGEQRRHMQAREGVLDSVGKRDPWQVPEAQNLSVPADVYEVHLVTPAAHRVGKLIDRHRTTVWPWPRQHGKRDDHAPSRVLRPADHVQALRGLRIATGAVSAAVDRAEHSRDAPLAVVVGGVSGNVGAGLEELDSAARVVRGVVARHARLRVVDADPHI
jgi:hypothetical protein